jgi:hypothetical protein
MNCSGGGTNPHPTWLSNDTNLREQAVKRVNIKNDLAFKRVDIKNVNIKN